jgi:endonuclease YncB( thermonuclease family)
MIRRLVLVALAIGLAAAAPAEVVGPARVVDGDPFTFGAERVRLWGVDAPEGRQVCQDAKGQGYACGDAARDQLVALIGGRIVRCAVRDRDPYRHAVSRCAAGSTDLGEAMIRAGWAIDYVQFSRGPTRRRRLRRAERGAAFGPAASRRHRLGGLRRGQRDRRRPDRPRPAARSRATSTPGGGGSSARQARRATRRPASTWPGASAGSVRPPRRGRRVGRRRAAEGSGSVFVALRMASAPTQRYFARSVSRPSFSRASRESGPTTSSRWCSM